MAENGYLLDTHCLIWFQENNPKIPGRIMQLMQDTNNIIFFTQVSLFEIAIKKSIGKLPGMVSSIDEIYNAGINDGFSFLSINNRHLKAYGNITLFDGHRDPFDRLIIATAIEENLTILSADDNFKLYADFVRVEW